ncbi:TIGR02466 family protein [Thalassobacter stenotrophicus]|uniref:TIGR02466 family protein n=1 Tax=Thalassobacter stenotrophicus TaxID=266809 RepID=UPI0022A9535C|nr:TIGR02466 family protein [Thalassobacter stenotrophicus]UYP67367.1 TIGR02466 family protein [Thalassobacter stenotrophicus]
MRILERTKYEKLFANPLFRYTLSGADILNSELLAEGERLRAESEGVVKSNRGGWHSSGNLFDNEAPCVQRLKSDAETAIIAATKAIGAKADLEELSLKTFAWMNANPPGGFNAPHTHPGAHWSGVYYVAQPDVEEGSSGQIEFLDPRTDLPNWRLLQAPAFRAKKAIRPKPGELILFPSYLVHWVYPNETSEERVSIAFNATFRKLPKSKNLQV